MTSRRRPGAPADFEEIRPNLFLIHNPALGPVLRGEGERDGFHFRLTSWRREGLLGRLTNRGFVTLTIADRIAALPTPPMTTLGPLHRLSIGPKQQLALLDLAVPGGWRLVSPVNGVVELPVGRIVRYRRGRGPVEYLRITAGGWQYLPADDALLHAYGQLPRPSLLRLVSADAGVVVPTLPLPTAYRQVLGQIAHPHPTGWLLTNDTERALASTLLAKLGVTVVAPEA
ncbi:MAG: hypothetical protein KatS3mg055_0754 [Chloroflexus sp.]|uniref:hypothetical protein n=1 Tax=Chloroflexus sp. TaxID=1904827 RepID=UPI0021DD341B|nr:hypothetical protein [Chloroflexus sp.]GIV88236.1 MAG: hypothetical protein KatS3mg055_0754 [Chloroflexus sp.]